MLIVFASSLATVLQGLWQNYRIQRSLTKRQLWSGLLLTIIATIAYDIFFSAPA